MSLSLNDCIKGQEKTSSCPAAKSILMLWRSHFFGSLCSRQKTVSAGQVCRKPARWEQLFSFLTLRVMLTFSTWRKPFNWKGNNRFFNFLPFLILLYFFSDRMGIAQASASSWEVYQSIGINPNPYCGKWTVLAAGGVCVCSLPSVILLSRGLYGQVTQGGCSLALCTSPAWPVPASPTPYSHDWRPYIFAPGPSWWLFLSKGQWRVCPSASFPSNRWASLTSIPQLAISSPPTRQQRLPPCPAHWPPHTVGVLLQDFVSDV